VALADLIFRPLEAWQLLRLGRAWLRPAVRGNEPRSRALGYRCADDSSAGRSAAT
jgi:ABC-type branched-subunit amino acid transport system permease subunit